MNPKHMKLLTGTVDLRLPLNEVNHINELIERDNAKAVKADEKYDLEYCPRCGKVVISTEVFCSFCGQRLDHENKAL